MSNASVKFSDFIRTAEKFGMPVGFLKEVARAYTVTEADADEIDHAIPWTNTLKLRTDTLDAVADFKVEKPHTEATSILNIYHEGTHGWIDLHEDDEDVKTILADGLTYYKGAPLDDGGTVSDENRVTQEALAAYVGNRAAIWWIALETLHSIDVDAPMTEDKKKSYTEFAKKTRQRYEQGMKLRVFGYQQKGFFDTTQIQVKKAIPGTMKAFCDRRILEGKFPDTFSANKSLSDRWAELKKVLPGIGD